MTQVFVDKVNETYIRVSCEPSIAQELSDYFTFDVPHAKFTPAFKIKAWDGKIRLYNRMTQLLYAGLLPYVQKFCKEREYEAEIDQQLDISTLPDDIDDFLKSLDLPMEVRDYQLMAFKHALQYNRALFLSPTSSGKSFIIYLLIRFFNRKTLIIVPTTTLVHQMASDFADYGLSDADDYIHKIHEGQEKYTNKLITISTWQSIYKRKKDFYKDYEVVIGDEAHLFKADSLTAIMTKLDHIKYRFGFTGTLDESLTNKLVLEGLFGAVVKVTTTAELIENKYAADFKIKAIVLKHTAEDKKRMAGCTYQEEIQFLTGHQKRNKVIANLSLSLKGNTLVLYNLVEDHGKPLYELIKNKAPDREVYFIHGGIDGEIRNDIRRTVEESENAIIVASYGTFSTGINIRNLHNIVFASPSKSRVRNLQSIGRGLRKSDTKDKAVLYDIADDLVWKKRKNHTIKHFVIRVKLYNEEKFEYKIYNMEL